MDSTSLSIQAMSRATQIVVKDAENAIFRAIRDNLGEQHYVNMKDKKVLFQYDHRVEQRGGDKQALIAYEGVLAALLKTFSNTVVNKASRRTPGHESSSNCATARQKSNENKQTPSPPLVEGLYGLYGVLWKFKRCVIR